MFDEQEVIRIRKILVQRQIRQRKDKIEALEDLLDCLEDGEISKEIML